jgi:methylase of polypeptide subunit release factors
MATTRALARAGTRVRRLLKRAETATDADMALEVVNGTRIVVLPGVFNGVRFHTGRFLAESLTASIVAPRSFVLDLGTGSGVCAVSAARFAGRVVATDINPEAVRCAWINILAHHQEHLVETRTGDLFEPVSGERFDLVLFNPPYFCGAPRDAADHALRCVDTFSRFLEQLGDYLAPQGRALVVLSPDTDIETTLRTHPQVAVSEFRTRQVLDKTLTIFEVKPR